ncbi:MAG: AI-2E family transporter [Lachnospiraceae bacterium]
MEFNRETMKKIRSLILFAAFILVCLWKYQMIFHVLFPFALGGAIALILNVPMDFVERHLFRQAGKVRGRFARKAARPVSLLLVLLLAAAVAAVVSFLLVPQLGRTFEELKGNIRAYTPRLLELQKEVDWKGIAVTAARSVVSKVAAFLIAFAFALYILLQKEKLGRQVRTVLFAFVRRGRAEAALEVCAFTYRTFAGFLAGQCVEALILGGLFVVSMLILKIPYALLMGVVISVTALVPVFGAFVGCGAGVILIFLEDPVKALVFLILFLVLQEIEGDLIYPHVVGNSVGLPPIWVLAAVSVGGSLMGVTGMLVSIPLAAVIYALFREIVYLKLRQKKIDPGNL